MPDVRFASEGNRSAPRGLLGQVAEAIWCLSDARMVKRQLSVATARREVLEAG